MDSFSQLLHRGFLVLDGGLATQLEKEGENLSGLLWSAKILQSNPKLIKKVHLDYLKAGADIITTASYQATFDGFKKAGYTEEEAEFYLKKSVSIAIEARDEFWNEIQDKNTNRIRPLIAGSAGCYGAWLANGEEFSGNYKLSKDEFKNFHRKRVDILLKSGADLIEGFETFPQLEEAEAVIELLTEFPESKGWISFSCKDEKHISHGENFSEVVELANKSSQIVAVGINCSAPRFVSSLLRSVPSSNKKPFIVYPNSGETWTKNTWIGTADNYPVHTYSKEWFDLGAKIIGGCCRTTPDDIKNIRAQLELEINKKNEIVKKTHPMSEFAELLKKQDPNDKREKVVLVSTGAYCPVHKMHFQAFQAAKKFLTEKHNFNVIAGFMSPSHDQYVSSKLDGMFIPSIERAEMIRLVAKSHEEFSWILCDEWESSRDHFLQLDYVIEDVDSEIRKKFPKENIQCMYICGADLIVRCGGMTSIGEYSLVAVGRPGYSDAIRHLKKEFAKEAEELYFVEEDTDDVSSTKIRGEFGEFMGDNLQLERMRKGLPLDDLTFKEVSDYIQKHNIIC